MRINDWSSVVGSTDLPDHPWGRTRARPRHSLTPVSRPGALLQGACPLRPTVPAPSLVSFRPRGSCRRTAPLSFRFSVARANLSPFSAPHGDNPDPAPPMQQRTIKNVIRATGVGLHSGEKVYLTLRPAPVDTGIMFRRVDIEPAVEVPANAELVSETTLCTGLSRDGAKVQTVEHLMSALAGLGIY